MKKLALGLPFFTLSLARAQDDEKEATPPPAQPGDGKQNFMDSLSKNYSTWDPVKIAWLVVTLAIAYGIATCAFLFLLQGRNPVVAAKYACFWGGIGFVLVHLFLFGALIHQQLSLFAVLGIAFAIVIAVILVLWLVERKK